ncbi:hypothetical protein PMZ80_007079 [Knufia obscura]|nr:hypothetical protein PMZ80_007079 [Knufia obscura]
MIEGVDDYYWNEMTFFIHQPNDTNDHLTVLCFEVPDDDVDDDDHSSSAKDMTTNTSSKPYNFLKQLRQTLAALPHETDLDWRCMQSLLLYQAVVVADIGVWACSKAVRNLEKSRIDSTTHVNASFNFPQAHDLLRHALHSTEVLQVAGQTLDAWLQRYLASQKRQQRLQHAQHARLNQNQPQANQQAQSIPFEEDTPLPPECYHDELLATFQLLSNLSLRSASNDARLRNEINLAFNVVNQQDTKAMRTISIVTLLFLPATFVSTLFSMTFFNQPSAEQPWGVSPMIWIYFVISVVMTAVTLVTWFWGARLWTSFFRNTKSKNA